MDETKDERPALRVIPGGKDKQKQEDDKQDERLWMRFVDEDGEVSYFDVSDVPF